ncbi:hypothetical protein PspLS_11154 [Pyricularia sp. CBS 133598]|nr:hypothetical protein PspLS_11154 [Pyricularia sp. CBS 133598]
MLSPDTFLRIRMNILQLKEPRPIPLLPGEKVITFHINYATGRTSWCHPCRLAELQDAGLVAASQSPAPFVEAPPNHPGLQAPKTTQPLSWYEEYDTVSGRSSNFLYPDAAANQALRDPDALAQARMAGSRELALFREVLLEHPLPVAEEHLAAGELPPWVEREMTVRDGELVHFYVDYRTDTFSMTSPVETFQRNRVISQAEARELGKFFEGVELLRYYQVSRIKDDDGWMRQLPREVDDVVRCYDEGDIIHYL